jgi:hypothetical protein
VRGWGTVLGRILVAAAVSELHDPLYTNVQGFHLLSYDALRHPLSEVLDQQSHTAILRMGEGVETHTLPRQEAAVR